MSLFPAAHHICRPDLCTGQYFLLYQVSHTIVGHVLYQVYVSALDIVGRIQQHAFQSSNNAMLVQVMSSQPPKEKADGVPRTGNPQNRIVSQGTHSEVTTPSVQLTPCQLSVQGSPLPQFASETFPSSDCTLCSTAATAHRYTNQPLCRASSALLPKATTCMLSPISSQCIITIS